MPLPLVVTNGFADPLLKIEADPEQRDRWLVSRYTRDNCVNMGHSFSAEGLSAILSYYASSTFTTWETVRKLIPRWAEL